METNTEDQAVEHTTLDNVREYGTNRVYRLMVATEGLHLLHVTNTEGLNDYAGGTIEHHTYRSHGDEQIDNLFEGQEEVAEQMNPAVFEQEYSRTYAWGQVHEATFSESSLKIHAGDDRYTFGFPNTPPDEVHTFVAKLMAQVEAELAGRREMRR